MEAYFLQNLSELAARRAISIREEAQLWDILSRDLKREAKRREEIPKHRMIRMPTIKQNDQTAHESKEKLYVGIKQAAEMMSMSRSSLYTRINAGHIKVRKAGKRTLIAVSDIQNWYSSLPEGFNMT